MPDPRKMLRIQLSNLDAVADPKLFFGFEADDDYEIWSYEGKFLGASLNYLRHCSYALIDFKGAHMRDLYHRDPFSQATLDKAIVRVLAGEPMLTDVLPFHDVTETKSSQLRTSRYRIKSLSAFRDAATGNAIGVVVVTHFENQPIE